MVDHYQHIYPWNQAIWQHLTDTSKRRNHALLFAGGTGLGKKLLAVALAHFVLSKEGADQQVTTLFEAGSLPDLHVIMPESERQEDSIGDYASRYFESHTGKPKKQITIEQIRKLGSALSTHPHISETRVILIYNAHKMNRNASNALLKNLEEPPQNTLFVLVSDEVSALPQTVRSRCSLVSFLPPNSDSALSWLQQQNRIPEDQLNTYLRLAGNQPLLALRFFEIDYLEQLKIILTDVNNLWRRADSITQVAGRWLELGEAMVVETLQKLVSDLLKCQLSGQPSGLFFPVQQDWIAKSGAKISRQELIRTVDSLNRAKDLLGSSADPRLILEQVCVQLYALPR